MGDLFLGPLASQSTISRLENAPSKTHGGAVVCATLMALKTLKSYFFFKHPQTLTSSIRKACARGNGVGVQWIFSVICVFGVSRSPPPVFERR